MSIREGAYFFFGMFQFDDRKTPSESFGLPCIE